MVESIDGAMLAPELAAALGTRRWDALPALADRVVAAAMAAPERTLAELGAAFVSVDEIVFACRDVDARRAAPPRSLLAVVDLVNAFRCFGAPLRSTCDAIARSWLDELSRAFAPHSPEALRVGLAALALDDMIVAHRLAGVPLPTPGVEYSWPAVTDDPRTVLEYFVTGIRKRAPAMTLVSVISSRATRLDPASVLWMARLAFHVARRSALSAVAAELRDLVASRVEAIHAVLDIDSPVGLTIAGGSYVIREVLQGRGVQQLLLGARVDNLSPVLVTRDLNGSPARIDRLRTTVAGDMPGLFALEHIGMFDTPDDEESADRHRGSWALVERATAGKWLPHLIAESPRTFRMAAMLGRSAGRILLRLTANGLVVPPVRPELMWAVGAADRFEVTGLSARAMDMLSLSRQDAVTYPVFPTRYTPPELSAGAAPQKSEIVYALAIMVAEWATGHCYAPAIYADYGAQPVDWALFDAPVALAQMLRLARDSDHRKRPSLEHFIDALDRVAG